LLILASERNLKGYNRLADMVDGNAYYWSSVNPNTFASYQAKLATIGDAVHEHGGVWIPSAAPGFDARMVGGTQQVERKNGDTLRTQVNTALESSPDVLGIISWNEFSENTYVEPSETFGATYLRVLSEINHLPPPDFPEFDSSEPGGIYRDMFSDPRMLVLGGIALVSLLAVVVIARRRGTPPLRK
jgi:hypothetical protein